MFRELVMQEIAVALDMAAVQDGKGRADLAEWWRWRAQDLQRYLDDAPPELAATG